MLRQRALSRSLAFLFVRWFARSSSIGSRISQCSGISPRACALPLIPSLPPVELIPLHSKAAHQAHRFCCLRFSQSQNCSLRTANDCWFKCCRNNNINSNNGQQLTKQRSQKKKKKEKREKQLEPKLPFLFSLLFFSFFVSTLFIHLLSIMISI